MLGGSITIIVLPSDGKNEERVTEAVAISQVLASGHVSNIRVAPAITSSFFDLIYCAN